MPPLLGKALGLSILKVFGATSKDLRDLTARRKRHVWVQGSSGYAGYTLSPKAEGQIVLKTVEGVVISLPIVQNERPVVELQGLGDWALLPNPRRGQWCPGVQPRAVPAHVNIEDCDG